jgi:hypothetical protein
MRHRSTAFALLLLLSGFGVATSTPAADLPYSEDFDGPNGAPWPAPWFEGSVHVSVADLQGNQARLNGDPAFVARMILPGYSAVNTEALVTVTFEDVHNQGFGFYVRQNGGTLQEYLPYGQGYAMFLKGNWYWPEDLGLWREIYGIETQFAWGDTPIVGGLESDVRYRLRYRVTQANPDSTLLQARVWIDGDPEPAAWTIEAFDTHPELQGTAGSFAIDIYNYSGFGHIFIDDLAITEYPTPSAVPDAGSGARFGILPPHPQPARGVARVEVVLPEAGPARLHLYDAAGRLVARPFEGPLPAGASQLLVPAVDDDARPLPAGVYFARLLAGGLVARERIVFID